MFKHLLKKFITLTISLFLVSSGTFFLMHALPGDPFTEEQSISKEILDALKHHFHLDEPLLDQYKHYLNGIIHFDFGPSLKYQGQNVADIIKKGFPISMLLGAEALFLSVFLGISFGSIAAFYHGKTQDHVMMILAVIGISLPSFIFASFLQYVLASKLDLFPVARWGSFMHTVLPAIALSAQPTAFIARLIRANIVEVLQQDYILTARSKGVSLWQLNLRHVLRNAILPVASYLGPLTASMLTGSFVVEKIFGIPGLGQWFVLSVMNRDYTLIMGLTIFYSTFLMLSVYIIDVLYSFIDPRIRVVKNG